MVQAAKVGGGEPTCSDVQLCFLREERVCFLVIMQLPTWVTAWVSRYLEVSRLNPSLMVASTKLTHLGTFSASPTILSFLSRQTTKTVGI